MIAMKDLSRTEILEAIDEWIVGRNAERDRRILRRRFVDGIKFDALAEEFDLSVRQTKDIVYKGKEKLLRHLGS